MAYVSSVIVEGIDQTREVPVKPLPSVLTVFKSVATPFFRRSVTGPSAPDQVMLKSLPAVTAWNSAGPMVSSTAALATARAAEARSARVKNISSIM